MITIDTLLIKIVNQADPTLEEVISPRDSKVLRNLASCIDSPLFITENQSRLLVKILRDNQSKLTAHESELIAALALPTWSNPFRNIEQVKKFNIIDSNLMIEFTFSSALRKSLTSLKDIENLVQINPGKSYMAELTEKNIVILYEFLAPQGFDISETIVEHYNAIKAWDEKTVNEQFLITNITHQNFQKAITADLGLETSIDKAIIKDRSIRYQYFTDAPAFESTTLTEKIANRDSTKFWIDSKNYSLNDVVKSVVALKRFPMLVVFDSFQTEESYQQLQELSAVLDENNINSPVGIYFRMPNDDNGKLFNDLIRSKQYNAHLDSSTEIVGVQSGKIPKFLLTNNWRPMSVLAIGTNLRHSKTAVYANCCDLVMSYTDTPTIMEKPNKWQ
jgi:hypothetical protein